MEQSWEEVVLFCGIFQTGAATQEILLKAELLINGLIVITQILNS